MNRVDVVVIGAGPGGCAAAYQLASSGYSVHLVDGRKPENSKVCAGGLSVGAWNQLPFTSDQCAALRSISRATISKINFTSSLKCAVTRTHDQPLLHLFERSEFDELLQSFARSAGAHLSLDSPVAEIVQDGTGVTVRTNSMRIRSRIVIGAWGGRSLLRKWLRYPPLLEVEPAAELRSGVSSYLTNDTALFDWDSIPSGYGWAWPKDDHLSVGVVAPRITGARMREYTAQLVAASGSDPATASGLATHLVPLSTKLAVEHERILLVGDAAGLADPFTREGIGNAVVSGVIAASSAERLLNEGRSGYQQAIAARFKHSLFYSHLVRKFLFGNTGVAHRLLRDNERFWAAMCAVLRQELDTRTLVRLLGEWG